jgi:hypothetical protein
MSKTTSESSDPLQDLPPYAVHLFGICIGPLLVRSWQDQFGHFDRRLFAYWVLGDLLWGSIIIQTWWALT